MAAKKRLWLVRRGDKARTNEVVLVRSDAEPTLTSGDWLEDRYVSGTIQQFCITEFERITGVFIPVGHVVPVESIQITLAGASRKAKVAT